MYQDSSDRRAPMIIGLVAGGFVLILLMIAVIYLARGPSMTEQLEAELASEPAIAGFIGELKTSYPGDYREMIDRVAEAHRTGGRQASSREAFFFMRGFMTSRVDHIASAPDRDLVQVAGAYVRVVEALRDSDVPLCAQFVMLGFSPGARPPRTVVEQLNNASVLQIRAAKAGERSGRQPRRELALVDTQAWFAEIRRLDAGAAAAIEDGSLGGRTPAEQCQAGLALYRGVTALPAPRAANVIAQLIRQSLQTPVPAL